MAVLALLGIELLLARRLAPFVVPCRIVLRFTALPRVVAADAGAAECRALPTPSVDCAKERQVFG